MTFFAIFLALLLEQARPLGQDNPVHQSMKAWARWSQRMVDAGQSVHAWLLWSLAAIVPAAASALVYWALLSVNLLLAFVWLVIMLYATLGFRQFSHHFTAIREALESGNENQARDALSAWQGVGVADLPRQELLRHVIEHSVIAAHRHVFGVLVSFVLLAVLGLGPAGAVLYRMAEYLSRAWRAPATAGVSEAVSSAVSKSWYWIDLLPVRVTALGFAVVGNFEEAVANWRQDAQRLREGNDGILLAATAGAINVRLGGRPLGEAPDADSPAAVTEGKEPQLAHLASIVGLVWRSVVLWLLLLALGLLASSV